MKVKKLRMFLISWILILIGSLFFVISVSAKDNIIKVFTMYDAQEISISASDVASNAINLSRQLKPTGYFSLQVIATGSGTAKIEYELSNDATDIASAVANWITPGTAVDIVTAQTSGSAMYSFAPMLAKWLRLVVTETGGGNTITLTINLAIQ